MKLYVSLTGEAWGFSFSFYLWKLRIGCYQKDVFVVFCCCFMLVNESNKVKKLIAWGFGDLDFFYLEVSYFTLLCNQCVSKRLLFFMAYFLEFFPKTSPSQETTLFVILLRVCGTKIKD